MRSIVQLAGHQRLIEGRHGTFIYNHYDRYVGRALELYGEYSEPEVDLFRQLLEPGHNVVEVGANIGAHTVPLAKMVPEGVVFAFEPQAVIFQNLCANLSVNCLGNVLAWPYGVGKEAGRMIVPVYDYARVNNFGGIALVDEGDGLEVPIVALDQFFPSQPVDFIKIDVEGMERAVLEGACHLIARCRPLIFVENDRVEHSKALVETLWGMNYRLYWHVSPLYNRENYFANAANEYPGVSAYNMLCLPEEAEFELDERTRVVDSDTHPLRK